MTDRIVAESPRPPTQETNLRWTWQQVENALRDLQFGTITLVVQASLAVFNYESAYHRLPTSTRPVGFTSAPRISWTIDILPFIEQNNLGNRYDITSNWDSTTNLPLTSQPIKIFQCPSTPNPTRLDGDPQTNVWNIVAVTDYAASTCVPSTPDGSTFPGACAAGCTNGYNYPAYAAAPFGTEGTSAPYSFHAAVLNAAFGDGSVRTVSNAVSVYTFAAVVTAAGGETPVVDY